MALFTKRSIVDEDPYIERENIKNNLGELEEAIKDYDKIMEILPEYILAYYNRRFIKRKLGKIISKP